MKFKSRKTGEVLYIADSQAKTIRHMIMTGRYEVLHNDEWNESDHPRGENGQFGGGGGKSPEPTSKKQQAQQAAVAYVNAGKKTDLPQYKNISPKDAGNFAKAISLNPYSVDNRAGWVFDSRGLKVDADALVKAGLIEEDTGNYKHKMTPLGIEIARVVMVPGK